MQNFKLQYLTLIVKLRALEYKTTGVRAQRDQQRLCVKLCNTGRSRAILTLCSSVQPHLVLGGTETLNRNNWRNLLSATIMDPLFLFLPLTAYCSYNQGLILQHTSDGSKRESREVLPTLYPHSVWQSSVCWAVLHLQMDRFGLTPLD